MLCITGLRVKNKSDYGPCPELISAATARLHPLSVMHKTKISSGYFFISIIILKTSQLKHKL
jgi:hypothetical protein